MNFGTVRNRLFRAWTKGAWKTGEGKKATYCLEGAFGIEDSEMSERIHIAVCNGEGALRNAGYESPLSKKEQKLKVHYEHTLQAIKDYAAEFPDQPVSEFIRREGDDFTVHNFNDFNIMYDREYLPAGIVKKIEKAQGYIDCIDEVKDIQDDELRAEVQALDVNLDDILWVWDRAVKYAEQDEASKPKTKK